MFRASLNRMAKQLSRRPGQRSWGPILAVCHLLFGCEEGRSGAKFEPGPAIAPGTSDGSYRPVPPPDLCDIEIERLLREEPLVGTPRLDQSRAEILARARSVPVVFQREPTAPPEASEKVLRLRALLLSEGDPAHAILEVLRQTRGRYEERRAIFLSEQYLYADNILLALRLSQVLRLDHLFAKHERELVIERGDEIIEVTRSDGKYWLPPLVSAEHPAKHHLRFASLLLFDRVRLKSEVFGERLHTDPRPLQRLLGFSKADIVHRSAEGFVLNLSTYGVPSRAIIESQDGRAVLQCESVDASVREKLRQARAKYHLDQELIDPVLKAAQEMIDRGLPFDEPKTEEGQQDGLLRIHFRKAYKHYQHSYEFNGDNYYVFDGYGRPRLPQVCIDFITDAFDLGTGGHWPDRGEKRLYQKGALNFASMGIENPRSVENLAEFASETPEWFDMVWFDKSEQIKFRHRQKFFDALAKNEDDFRRGDVVFIYGLKDDGKFHYHSFLIDEKDPITGMPTVVAANAGPPQSRSWEGEMQNAPQRSIVARMRVKRDILLRAHAQKKAQPGVPLKPPPRQGEEVEVPEEQGAAPPPLETEPTPVPKRAKAVAPRLESSPTPLGTPSSQSPLDPPSTRAPEAAPPQKPESAQGPETSPQTPAREPGAEEEASPRAE